MVHLRSEKVAKDMPLPKAVLLDLDDTILNDSGNVELCWRAACAAHASELADIGQRDVFETIQKTSRWFWSDPERHRLGRFELDVARREVVRLALLELGVANPILAARIGDAYSHHRDVGMEPLPEAIDTVRWLRELGCRLALLTNGAGPAQRKKISRFNLTDLFDAILVEGEVGFGKPDERIYNLALQKLDVVPSDAWMVGDNLEWDIEPAQKLGLCGVWIDVRGKGVPEASAIRPDRVVRTLSELKRFTLHRPPFSGAPLSDAKR
jgi:putative hydrolase of the HAD superfamily